MICGSFAGFKPTNLPIFEPDLMTAKFIDVCQMFASFGGEVLGVGFSKVLCAFFKKIDTEVELPYLTLDQKVTA